MKQILGGVIHDVNSLGIDYFIHLSTATKMESKIRQINPKTIYLMPDAITDNDLKRCSEAGLSDSVIKDIKDKMEIRNPSNKLHNEELIDCDKNLITGINEIIYAIHKYYYPETKRIECSTWIGDEVYNFIMQYSK